MRRMIGVAGQSPGKTTTLALQPHHLAGSIRADTRYCDFYAAGGLLYFLPSGKRMMLF